MGVADFTPRTVRVAFFDREKERCFRCRRPLRFEGRGFEWSAHHRKPRGMGGAADPVRASIANCLVLCGSGTTGCHGWVEKERDVATAHGYLIPKNATTETFAPAAVRVRRWDGSWWLMTESGRAVEVEEGMPQ